MLTRVFRFPSPRGVRVPVIGWRAVAGTGARATVARVSRKRGRVDLPPPPGIEPRTSRLAAGYCVKAAIFSLWVFSFY